MARVRAWIMAEFANPTEMLDAVRQLRKSGHKDIDTYSPYPLEHGSEALGLPRSRVPLFVLGGAIVGAATGYLLQFYANAVSYPINVGGRPLHSAPSYIPITFELAVLFGAFGAFFGLLYLLKLPQPYHPVHEADGFDRASVDKFWVSVAWRDSAESWEPLMAEMAGLGGRVVVVEPKV